LLGFRKEAKENEEFRDEGKKDKGCWG